MATVARDVRAENEDIERAIAGKTVCSMFADLAEKHGDEEAIKWRDADGWTGFDWRQYRDRARAATMALLKLGFGKGQFGVIMARNVPEHVIADWGVVHAGGAGVSLYNTLAPEQVRFIAGHCEASVAFVENEGFLAKFEAVRDRLPHLRHIVMFEGSAPGVISWADFLREGEKEARRDPDAFDSAWKAIKPDDLVSLIYTSGTTGPPKGVMYSHRNLTWTIESAIRVLKPPARGRLISYLPLSHIAERFTSHWQTLGYGGVTYYEPDITRLVPTLLEVRPTLFVGVPRVWEKFAAALQAAKAAGVPDAELKAKVGLDLCERPVTSTAPIPMDVLKFFDSIGLTLIEVWGMSELTGPATITPADAIRLGAVGPPMPGQEIKVDTDGEILVRGGNVMVGYYKEPEKTADTIDPEGWLRTGDVGAFDEAGYLKIVDRKKEIIITAGGKNMSPANMEGLLKHHPLIGQACVVGDRRPYVTALIVLDQEVAPGWAKAHGLQFSSSADLAGNAQVLAEVQKGVDYANEQMSRHEQVKKFRILPVEWTAMSEELTPTLKLRRRVVNEKYAAQIEEMYADGSAR